VVRTPASAGGAGPPLAGSAGGRPNRARWHDFSTFSIPSYDLRPGMAGTLAVTAPVTVMADPNPRSKPIPVDEKAKAAD